MQRFQAKQGVIKQTYFTGLATMRVETIKRGTNINTACREVTEVKSCLVCLILVAQRKSKVSIPVGDKGECLLGVMLCP